MNLLNASVKQIISHQNSSRMKQLKTGFRSSILFGAAVACLYITFTGNISYTVLPFCFETID
jgi:hypothetical protein